MTKPHSLRRFTQGAEVTPEGVSFRIWAPEHRRVDVLFPANAIEVALQEDGDGFWSALVPIARAGDRYYYRLDGEPTDLPDPAARFLPEGPLGPAQIVDPQSFGWTDANWTGLTSPRQAIYELHVGTFSPEGTWSGLEAKLPLLRDLGITAIEIMPVAEFAGRFGWGYDGVAWFAPSHLYGTPDDFRRVVNRAHALGLGVILDVVYNHLGAVGNYAPQFSSHYVGEEKTEWGAGLNYDGNQSHAMRALAVDNATHWIADFHLDGLRLDAIQAIVDRSSDHIVSAIARAAHAAAGGRRILIVGEDEPQDARMLRNHRYSGVGSGLDALWNDDFHHTARVALTGRRQAYFSDYRGLASEWITAAKRGFLYQGQRSAWQDKGRGHPTLGLPMSAFVCFLENHDQVANSLWSSRLWQQSSPGQHRAMTALLLLGPWTALLFQGQEWNSCAPFHYFADHDRELAKLVKQGRAEFLSQFPGCAANKALLCDPAAPATFELSRLHWEDKDSDAHARALQLHRDLLHIRQSDPTLGAHAPTGLKLEAAVLGPACGMLRYFVDVQDMQHVQQESDEKVAATSHERILLVNLGADLEIDRVTEPLLAPPSGLSDMHWRISWSSEDPVYGGHGCAEPEGERGWLLPGATTLLLVPGLAPKVTNSD